jgi:hypothetical protein
VSGGARPDGAARDPREPPVRRSGARRVHAAGAVHPPKLATYKGTFGANGKARFRFKRPRKIGYYAAAVMFGGTRFVRPGADPYLIPLGVTRRSIRFVRPQAYPRC